MKKILTILMFVAVFGLILGSVNATDLQEHDFDGHFTLDVPTNAFFSNAGADGYEYTSNDGQGLKIQYITTDDIDMTFDEFIQSLGLKDGKTDENFTIFQDGGKYVVITNSSDEMYIITDKDLDEAKAIATSADLGADDKTESSNGETSDATYDGADLEKVKMGKVLTINAPKGSDLDEATFDGFWTVAYTANTEAAVYYACEETAKTKIDDAFYKEFLDNVTSQEGVKSSVEGNATIVEGIQNIDGTNAGYVHGDNEMVIVISNDLGLVKEMVKSIEFN